MVRACDAKELERMLGGGREAALLDVRAPVPYGRGHILWSVNLPYDRLELDVGCLVPRPNTPLVLLDDGEGLAPRAAAHLTGLGYHDLFILERGVRAWAEAGHVLHRELEVAVKGFSAFAERHGQPRFVEPAELKAQLDRGGDWIVLDSRPFAEYREGSIPGAVDAPGPALLRSFYDLVPNPETDVVVNCATRTRGILGGLTLKAAGVPNRIHVLRNGTRGWLLAGLDLERGAERRAPAPSPRGRDRAVAAVRALSERAGIARISPRDLEAWRRETDRTTYVFDVRGAGEYRDGHLPGAVNAPSGSLIMSFERYFATLNARVVLTDDDGIRAAMTAIWLAQIGACRPFVLEGALDENTLEQGCGLADRDPVPAAGAEPLEPDELVTRLDGQAVRIIDLGASRDYRLGHVPGALWMLRADLAEKLPEVLGPSIRLVVLTSDDGRVAALAGPEARALTDLPVRVLRGGNQAWRSAGLVMTDRAAQLLSAPDDCWLASNERPNPARAMRDYLDWETGLLRTIEADGPLRYRNLLWD